MIARLAALAGAGLLLLTAGESRAADLGPFSLGMTFEQARAASPKAKWSDVQSDRTGRVVEIEGREAFKLGNYPFRIGLRPLAYGGYRMDAVHTVERGARRDGCQAVVSALAQALEPRFGPLGPMTPLSDSETGGLPIGFDLLSMMETRGPVAVGQGSRAEVFQAGDTDNTRWITGRRDAGMSVLIGGRYIDRDTAMWPTSCVVSVRIISMPPRPDFEMFDVARLATPLAPPPLSVRRRSFADLPQLPATAADVEVVCDVERRFGQLRHCKAAAGVDERLAKPASWQAERLRLDPADLDPDNDTPLRAKLTVRVDPADAVMPGPPAGETPLVASNVVWEKQPSGADISRYYPDRALRMEVSARIAVLCRIEANGDLGCPNTTVTAPAEHAELFDNWGEVVERLYHAAPRLGDGTPSAGRWVRLTFNLAAG